MALNPLKIGIAGANPERGWARDAHIPALSAMPGLCITAVSARTEEIADQAAATFGAAKGFIDTLAMVHDPDVDIVAVTVKVPEHRAIVLAALAAGKHVYCEWPLARNSQEAEELVAAASRAGTHVVIGLQGSNSRAVQEAAKRVRAGDIGLPLTLQVVSSTSGWGSTVPPHYRYLQHRSNGATLASIAGGHTLAAVMTIIGEFVELNTHSSITCPTPKIIGSEETIERDCADHIVINARHANGCQSHIEIIGGGSKPFQFILKGTSGTLEITGHHPGGFQCADLALDLQANVPSQPQSFANQNAVNVASLWSDFERDIRTGTRSVPDFRTGLKVHRLLDRVNDSSTQASK